MLKDYNNNLLCGQCARNFHYLHDVTWTYFVEQLQAEIPQNVLFLIMVEYVKHNNDIFPKKILHFTFVTKYIIMYIIHD